MSWQDDPVVEETPQGQPAWASDPVVEESPGQDIPSLVNAAAVKYQLDPRLFMSQMQAESNLNPKAVSKAGAQGVGQLMPGTAADLGVTDPFDPVQNVDGAARYMRQLMDRYQGDTDRALAAYNWGMGNVDKFGTKMLPKETRDYLAKIKASSGNVQPVQQPQQPAPPADTSGQERDAFLGLQYRQGKPAPDSPLGRQVQAEATGFAQGMTGAADAAGQIVSGLMPDELERYMLPGNQTFNERLAEREKRLEAERKQLGMGPSVGFGVGAVTSPVNTLMGPAAKGVQALMKGAPRTGAVLGSAAAGGLAAGATPTNVQDDESFLASKAGQVATGAVLGPVVEGTGRAIVKGLGHVAGTIANKMSSDDVAQLQQLSEKWGIDLLAGDYDTNRRLYRAIEGGLMNSRIPGLNIGMEGQQAQGRAAVEKLVKAQGNELKNATFQSLDAVRKVAAGNSVRAPEATAILKMVDEAGDDARKIIQASGNLKWLRMKLSSDELYDDVERLAGKADVHPFKTLDALNKAQVQAEKVVDVDRETLNLISRWESRLNGMPGPGESAPPANTYMRMREFVTDLQNRVENATSAGVTKSGQLWLKDIIKAAKQDMDVFAQSKPALKAANERANKFYNDRVVPFQKETLAKALKNDDPDAVYGAFIRSGADWRGPHKQEELFKALDEKGRAAVRAGILDDAFRQATTGQFAPDNFTPIGFNKIMRQTGYETYFQGPARRELDGLLHIVDHISRSDPAKLATYTPLLGNIAAGGTAAGLVTGTVSLPAAAMGLASTGAMKWLVTSPTGKKLLHSANLYKPGGKHTDEAMTKIMENIVRGAATSSAIGAGQEQTNPGSVLP